MLPSLKELSYFYHVAIAKNLSKTALQLGVSQPALTLAIKRLESTIGTTLFIRHKMGVTLSQAGKHFLIHVKPLIQYWENAKSQTLSYHRDVQGKFTIGCHSISVTQLNQFLPQLLTSYPNLEINVHHDISRNVCNKIIDLSIDIGIVAKPIEHPDLIITKLYDNEFSLWTTDGLSMVNSLSDGNAVLICDPNLTQSDIIIRKLKRSKINFSRMLTTNSIESAASMTASGCGIGILPSCYATTVYPAILRRVAKSPTHQDEVCLVYRHENGNIQAIKIITAAIKKSLREQ
jgi:DNA-binding transcriptional LysR family regulator